MALSTQHQGHEVLKKVVKFLFDTSRPPLTQIIKSVNLENNDVCHLFSQYVFVFVLQSTFNCQCFQYLSGTWGKVKEQFFCPNPKRKQYLQLILTDSIAKQQAGTEFLTCTVHKCSRAGGRCKRGQRETLKTNHIWGLISSK